MTGWLATASPSEPAQHFALVVPFRSHFRALPWPFSAVLGVVALVLTAQATQKCRCWSVCVCACVCVCVLCCVVLCGWPGKLSTGKKAVPLDFHPLPPPPQVSLSLLSLAFKTLFLLLTITRKKVKSTDQTPTLARFPFYRTKFLIFILISFICFSNPFFRFRISLRSLHHISFKAI